MNPRQQRGYEIYKTKTIMPTNKGWIVPSQTTNKKYTVSKIFKVFTQSPLNPRVRQK